MAFHPLVDLLKRQFGIEESDGERGHRREDRAAGDGRRRRPRARSRPICALCCPSIRATPTVQAMSPAQRRGETFEALRRLLVRAAEQRPQVLRDRGPALDRRRERAVPGDAGRQRAGAPGAARLHLPAGLRESLRRAHLLHPRRPGGAVGRGQRAHGGGRRSPPTPCRTSCARSSRARPRAIPFYVEELVKSLEESGALRPGRHGYELARPVSEIAIPGTIQDVIAARIDRLAEAPKRTLQLASVIGREFTRRLVDRLAEIRERTEEFLRELTALELIYEQRRLPRAGLHVQARPHPGRRLRLAPRPAAQGASRPRRPRHRRAVRRSAPEHYEMLAHHFSRAEDWERALDYLLKAAGEGDARRSACARRSTCTARRSRSLGRLGERVPAATLMAIHRARADLFFGIGDFDRSRAEAEALVELTRRVQDRPRRRAPWSRSPSRCSGWRTSSRRSSGRVRRSRSPRAVGAQAPLGGALHVRGYVHLVSGRLEAAEEDLGRALAIGRAGGETDRQALGAAHPRAAAELAGRVSDEPEVGK